MHPNSFNDIFGTFPLKKKRLKRNRSNDVFDSFEGNFDTNEDIEELDMFNFETADQPMFSGEYQEIGSDMNETLIRSSQSISQYYQRNDDGQFYSENSEANLSNVADLQQGILSCRNDLILIRSSIEELLRTFNLDQLDTISQMVANVMNNLQNLVIFIQNEECSKFLEAAILEVYSSSENEIHYMIKEAEIYIKELNHIKNPSYYPELVSLVIEKQPFPKSVKQNKPLKESIIVKLITGSCTTYRTLGPMTGSIIMDFQTRSKQQITVSNNISEVNNDRATFDNIVFPFGTRKRVIRMKFNVNVEIHHKFTGETFSIQLESSPTKPIIVKTNENQWEESEGILLKYETFKENKQSTWCQFSNALQKRYLFATKQVFSNPPRPLSMNDFHFISKIKFNIDLDDNTSIDSQQFDKFWSWFGPGIHKIRYQRHLCKLWVNGYISGFIPRNEAEMILKDSQPGTFLIRLSERMNGAFTIAYTTLNYQQIKVSHYMISSDDVFGAKKTLPDFLGGESGLTHMVVLNLSTNLYETRPKDDVLGEFYSKRNTVDHDTEGYDRKIIRPSYSFGK